jgi:hypothetical protein
VRTIAYSRKYAKKHFYNSKFIKIQNVSSGTIIKNRYRLLENYVMEKVLVEIDLSKQ